MADFSAQNVIPNPDAAKDWAIETGNEFLAAGATCLMFSAYQDIDGLILVEGWREMPDPMLEPHYHLVATGKSDGKGGGASAENGLYATTTFENRK